MNQSSQIPTSFASIPIFDGLNLFETPYVLTTRIIRRPWNKQEMEDAAQASGDGAFAHGWDGMPWDVMINIDMIIFILAYTIYGRFSKMLVRNF